MLAGLSSLGMLLAYAVETSVGVKPSAFNKLNRINAIGGITIDREAIDASAIEDLMTRTIAGRQDNGGSFSITINVTSETITEWETLIEAYETGKASSKMLWFEIYHPQLSKAWFVVAEPPIDFPMPDVGQNELLTVELPLTINEYKGLDTAVKPADAE